MYYIYVWKTLRRCWAASTSRLVKQGGYSNINEAHTALNKVSARYGHQYHYRVVPIGQYPADMPAPE